MPHKWSKCVPNSQGICCPQLFQKKRRFVSGWSSLLKDQPFWQFLCLLCNELVHKNGKSWRCDKRAHKSSCCDDQMTVAMKTNCWTPGDHIWLQWRKHNSNHQANVARMNTCTNVADNSLPTNENWPEVWKIRMLPPLKSLVLFSLDSKA